MKSVGSLLLVTQLIQYVVFLQDRLEYLGLLRSSLSIDALHTYVYSY